MASKSSRRSDLVKRFLGAKQWHRRPFAHLTVLQLLIFLASSVILSVLLVGYQFQNIPDCQVGDIADRTIEASQDFQVEDKVATHALREESIKKVPVVFVLDLRINRRLESGLRSAFADARHRIAREKQRLGIPSASPLPSTVRSEFLGELAPVLTRFAQGGVLEICLDDGFSPSLEAQVVKILKESMKPPGVILARDILLQHQERGMLLRNAITGKEDPLSNWIAIRDLGQARDVLRQNEYELTAVGSEEKKKLISFLDSWIVPNVQLDEAATEQLTRRALEELDPVLIQVRKGRTIIRVGDEVGAREFLILQTLKSIKQPRRLAGKFVGIFLVVTFFLFALGHYTHAERKRGGEVQGHHLLLLLILTLCVLVSKFFMVFVDVVLQSLHIDALQNPIHLYLLAPLALGAVLATLLTNVHLTTFYSLTFSVFVVLLSGESSLFVYSLAGSLAARYALEQYRERSAIIRAGMIIGCVNLLVALAQQLYSASPDFLWLVFSVRSFSALLSGLFAAMLASLLLPVLESLFEVTTDIRLLELSNLNNPILRRLALEAPGTYHHSIIVGTLAEAAAERIGANALLVRVGAYYHDIGKLKTPEYYVENQIYSGNKHENLSPSMSSLILASHVKDGLAIAREIKLLPRVRDLIPEHHGTRVMTYFYRKAKEAESDQGEKINESDFRYPGPKPRSKEAAILMLADQIEAASRTLEDPTPGQIRGLIRRLVQGTIEDGQFDECDITMKELDQITETFGRVLSGMYHHRVQYPGFDFNKGVVGTQTETQRIQ